MPFSRDIVIPFHMYWAYITKFGSGGHNTHTKKLLCGKIIIEFVYGFFLKTKTFSVCLIFFNRGITLVCLKCDFLADSSTLDRMAKHLSQRKTHTCQVIIETRKYR